MQRQVALSFERHLRWIFNYFPMTLPKSLHIFFYGALSFSDRRRGAVQFWAKVHCKPTILHREAEQRTAIKPTSHQLSNSPAFPMQFKSIDCPWNESSSWKEVPWFTLGQFEMFDLTSALRNVRNADCMPVLVRWTLVLWCLPPWLQTRAWVTPKQEVPCRCLLLKSFWTANVHQSSETKCPWGQRATETRTATIVWN